MSAPRPFLHPLAGARALGLVRILLRHGGFSPRYAGQVGFMALGAMLRWPFCTAETWRVAHRVAEVKFDPPPIFIIGHWRSGTTFLHNLISRDPAFTFPTAADVLRPYEFYPSPFDVLTRTLVKYSLPSVRPMDNVPMTLDLPQEDEFAMAAMAAPSFLNCLFFPRQMSEIFAREVLFDGLDPADHGRWRRAVRYYLGKLQARQPGQRLLIKNPAHSARVAELRQLFPGAQFIHIHRDPVDVVRSTGNLYRAMLPMVALQSCDAGAIDDHVVTAYRKVMTKLIDSLRELPPRDIVEVRYDDLAKDPAGEVERVYQALQLRDFGRVRAAIIDFASLGAPSDRRAQAHAPSEFLLNALAPFRVALGYDARRV